MKLLACMAHVDPDKLPYLKRQLLSLKNLGIAVHVYIITNIDDPVRLENIRCYIPEQEASFIVNIYNEGCLQLKSPWLLTWVHKQIMQERFEDESYTHFLNIEDDMDFNKSNFDYWIKYRDALKPQGLFPSFIRIEVHPDTGELYWTDSFGIDRFNIQALPSLRLTDDYWFVNLPRYYQGMFLYDRDLMSEHINSDSFCLEKCLPDFEIRITHDWPLGLTERACFGISDHNVPSGAMSRNFVPVYRKIGLVDPCAYVHHMPNKYIKLKESKSGKTRLASLFSLNTPEKLSVSAVHSAKDLQENSKVSNKWSSYLPYYDELFIGLAEKPIRLLEIGVQNGGSLETWSTFFFGAEKIVGCDIDNRCKQLNFSDPRISVLVGNANSDEIYRKLVTQGPFDVIIDDGSHDSKDIIVSYVNYFQMLRPGGIYVVEDTHAMYSQIGSVGDLENCAFGFFKALTEMPNYQFWGSKYSQAELLKRFFSVSIPPILLEGWVESIEFRNSIITIKKSITATHDKVGYMYITGNVANVDVTPLRVKLERQQRTA